MSKEIVSLPTTMELRPEVDNVVHTGDGRCPACDTAQTSGAAFCPACGRALKTSKGPPDRPERAGAVQEGSPPPEAPGQLSAEEYRPLLPLIGPSAPKKLSDRPSSCACGTVLPSEASFCHHCGLRVGQQKPRFRLVRKAADQSPLAADLTGDELTIGKEVACDLVIPDDEYVSRRHARIFRSNGMIFLEDLGSSNGTFLRVRRPIVLQDDDEIVIGTSVLHLETGPSAGAVPCGR